MNPIPWEQEYSEVNTMFFGIEVTPGHIIIGLIFVALYDLAMDLIAPDPFSDKWFQRKNVPYRAIGFGALITIAALAQIDPALAVWLAAGLILTIGGYFWLKRNHA